MRSKLANKIDLVFRRVLFGRLISALVAVAINGWRMRLLKGRQLIGMNVHVAINNNRLEAMQSLFVVIFTNTGVETEVPIVNATNDIVAIDVTVRQQRATVRTATIKTLTC